MGLPAKPGPGAKTPHILVIEDDRDHQDLILRAFRDDPDLFRVSVAANIRDARKIIERDRPDLIFADWNLPDGKGIDVLSRSDDIVTLPVVIMTGYGDEHLAVEIMKSGAVDYIVKSATIFEEIPRIARKALRYWQNICDRRQAEQVVRDSQKRLADILSFLPDAMLAIDNNGTVIAWNNAIEEMTGVPAADMLGKGNYEYSIPFYGERRPILVDLVLEDDPEVKKKYLYANSDGQKIVAETFIPGMYGGRGAHLWGIASPLFDTAGNHTGAVEVIRDITDRKKTEMTLQESETRFRDLFNNMSAGVVIYEATPDGGDFIIRDANRAVETIERVKKEEIIGRSVLEAFPGVREFGLFAVFQRVAKTGIAESFPVSLYQDNRISGWRENYVYKLPSGEVVAIYEDVTEQKQAEEALRQKTALLEAQLNSSIDGILIVDSQGKKIIQNRRCIELWKIPAYVADDPDDQQQVNHVMHMTKNPEQFVEKIVYLYGHPEETSRDEVELTDGMVLDRYSAPVLGEDGHNYGRIWTFHDITERKQAEVTLRESETRFRALIQNSSDIIRILDRDGRIIYESSSAARILGYPPDYVIGRDAMEFIHPDDLERVKMEIGKVYDATNDGTPTEFRIRKADGEYIWVDSIGINLLDVPGVEGIVITTRSIQQRKESEQALHESEERLRLALEGADAGFWDLHILSGKAVFSSRFYTMLGYKPGEFPATLDGWSALVHPDDKQRIVPSLIEKNMGIQPQFEIEYRLMAKDSNWLWVLCRGKVVETDSQGNPVRVTGVNIDITNRRMMESEIRSLNTVLEQRVKDRTEALVKVNDALEEENAQRLTAEEKIRAALEEKTMLLKEIHHRVKNNLQIIVSLLNLQSRYIKDDTTRTLIRESQNRVKAMAIVHEKLYKTENISHIDLNDYIMFLGTGLFQFYDARSRGIRFTLDIHGIDVDINTAIPLGLIINELISNSLKYAFPEGKQGEVFISVQKADHALTVIFRDNGIGIPEDFDWKNTASLGLRLVNTLVDQLNGTIEIDRSAGTQFMMVLHEKA